MMRAAVYTGARTIRTADLPERAPGPGEVALDVAYTGICGTDLHILHGDMDARVGAAVRAGGAVLGHEMSGRIAALGAGVAGWSVGEAVTVLPLRWCGACAACRAGDRHVCLNLVFLGIDAPGAMQRRWTVPADTLVRLPPGVPLQAAALVEPLAVAVHDVRRAGLAAGERVLVVGGGPVGLLVAAVARREGADVVVVEPNAFRREVAAGWGLRAVDPDAEELTALVDDWTAGGGVDAAFEVSGSQAGLDAAVAALTPRGRLVLVGIHPVPRPVDLFRVFWRELSLHGARLYRRADFETAVEIVAGRQVPVADLITRVVPLDRADQAFAALESGGRVMKVLVDCGAGS